MKLALSAYAENAATAVALDAEAHVAALASLLLVTSALTPAAKPAWRKRMQAAVMRLIGASDDAP